MKVPWWKSSINSLYYWENQSDVIPCTKNNTRFHEEWRCIFLILHLICFCFNYVLRFFNKWMKSTKWYKIPSISCRNRTTFQKLFTAAVDQNQVFLHVDLIASQCYKSTRMHAIVEIRKWNNVTLKVVLQEFVRLKHCIFWSHNHRKRELMWLIISTNDTYREESGPNFPEKHWKEKLASDNDSIQIKLNIT